MAEAILWATLVIAASSLVFAFIAFRQVMTTSSEVHETMNQVKAFMVTFKKQAKGIFTPKFVAETLEQTVCAGLIHDDGTPVRMPEYIAGWAHAVGPGMWQEIKAEIPSYIPLIMNPDSSPQTSPGAPQRRDAKGQFGTGGLKAAQNVGKAAGKLPFGQKIAGYVENARAVVELGGAIKELKNEVFPPKGGGNGDADQVAGSDASEGMTDWGPPF